MAAEGSKIHSQYDQGIPPWKKELLLRKKHSKRPVWAPSSKYGTDFHPVRNMRLKSETPDFLVNVNDNPVKMKDGKRFSSKAIDKLRADYLNSIKSIDLNGKDDIDRNSDSSEELQYGPGIVNKLKSKYLSMTLRDNSKYSRPSLANLRRATSLENMLDDEKSTPKAHFIKKSTAVQKSPKISQHHAKYLGISKGESMKRARSMDTLFKNDKTVKNGIVNEDLVIVDKDGDFVRSQNDREMPPPDVVKQTKKIFEKTSDLGVGDKRNKKTVLSKVGNVYDKQVDRVKPQLSPKPVFTGDKLPPRWPNKKIYPVVTSTTRVTSPVKGGQVVRPVSTAARPLPESRPDKPVRLSVSVKPNTSAESSPLLSPVSIRSSPVSLEDAVGSPDSPTRGVSPAPRVASPVAKPYENSLSSCFPRRNLMQATNTCLVKNQSTEPASVKQVAVIRPIPAKKPLTEQELENNLINNAKSIQKSSEEVCIDDSTVAANDAEQVQSWEKKSWQSTNSMVFNFSSRPTVPDYIENDGLNLPNRVVSKSSNKDEVDTEEEWEAPHFCDVSFVGDNVLINGKSNLRKEPNPNKARRIKFNDEATTLYEYPSEDSLIEEAVPSEPASPRSSPLPPSPSPSPLGGSILSRYTPSKSPTPADFELGVTSSASVLPQPQQHSANPHSSQLEDYLKPVDLDQETAWSQETTSDILF